MSREAVMDLLAKADKDEGLRKELEAVADGTGDRAADFLAVAREHGCHFTAEEFGEVVSALPHGGEAELSDDDLEGVVGGIIEDNMPVLKPRTIGTFTRLRGVMKPGSAFLGGGLKGTLPEPMP